jgi:hypothetical protein
MAQRHDGMRWQNGMMAQRLDGTMVQMSDGTMQ